MNKIAKIIGRQIIDSRGNPTVEADLFFESGQTFFIVITSKETSYGWITDLEGNPIMDPVDSPN